MYLLLSRMSEDADIVYISMPLVEESPLDTVGWIAITTGGILTLGAGVGGMIYVFMNYVL